MRLASFDLGTNTLLCLVVDIEADGRYKILYDGQRTVRLGQKVAETKMFQPEALERVEQALTEYRQELIEHKVEYAVLAATSATRDVTNRDELLHLLSRFGLVPEVLSGDDEARLTFAGAFSGADVSTSVGVIDVGGGSTEVVFGVSDHLNYKKSFNVGCVRETERFFSAHPIPENEIRAASESINQSFAELRNLSQVPQKIYAVAGTPTTLATMSLGRGFERDAVHGYRLTLEELKNYATSLARLSVDQRAKLAGADPGRADVLVIGAMILSEVVESLGRDELIVSVQGLRYGLLKERHLWRAWRA